MVSIINLSYLYLINTNKRTVYYLQKSALIQIDYRSPSVSNALYLFLSERFVYSVGTIFQSIHRESSKIEILSSASGVII